VYTVHCTMYINKSWRSFPIRERVCEMAEHRLWTSQESWRIFSSTLRMAMAQFSQSSPRRLSRMHYESAYRIRKVAFFSLL